MLLALIVFHSIAFLFDLFELQSTYRMLFLLKPTSFDENRTWDVSPGVGYAKLSYYGG